NLELLRGADHIHCHGVYVTRIAADIRAFLSYFVEYTSPKVVRGDRVRLVGECNAVQTVSSRVVERVTDYPLNALPGINLLRDKDLVWRPLLETSANGTVEPFSVLSEDHHVDVRGGFPL